MSFQDAVRTCLTQKYADFNGRARRSEFWFFILFTVIVGFVATVIDAIIHTSSTFGGRGLVSTIAQLALLLPQLAVGARRLHDTDKTGWWQLLYITVIGIIVLIIFWVQDSKGDNKHGPNPKGVAGGQYYQEMPPPSAPQY
jgi:uncharacterized membrane protein YhaH (DUF805 family)